MTSLFRSSTKAARVSKGVTGLCDEIATATKWRLKANLITV
ncbi:hypothetical protein [Mycetocola zhujimingii]|nr:hypothetical protein [Mycetocola zhujimingii]